MSKEKQTKNYKARNTVIWFLVFVVIIALLGLYFYNNKEEETPQKENPREKFEKLLEMDYNIADYEETGDKIILKLKGSFRDSDILSYQNKIMNLVNNKNIDIYYFENTATDFENISSNNPDFIGYTSTNFYDLKMTYSKYQELPSLEKSKTINKFNVGTIETIDDILTITIDMDLDTGDYASIASNAKAFIDLFKRTNKEKDIGDIKLILSSDENYTYIYNTKEPNSLMVQEIKTFSKK